MTDATPTAGAFGRIGDLQLLPGLTPSELAERLFTMPETVEGLERREVSTAVDSATVVYLASEDQPQPRYGMAIALIVEPAADAAEGVAEIRKARWGDPAEHHVTEESAGSGSEPAYVAFWRVFPPGLFAIPNQPVYFAIWRRANDGYAFMTIGGEPAIRDALMSALVETLSTS